MQTPEERLARLEAEVFEGARKRRTKPQRLDSLADVKLTGALDGDSLVYDKPSGRFLPRTANTAHFLYEHLGVQVGTLLTDDVLAFDASTEAFKNKQLPGASVRLEGVTSPIPAQTVLAKGTTYTLTWRSTRFSNTNYYAVSSPGTFIQIKKPGRYLVSVVVTLLEQGPGPHVTFQQFVQWQHGTRALFLRRNSTHVNSDYTLPRHLWGTLSISDIVPCAAGDLLSVQVKSDEPDDGFTPVPYGVYINDQMSSTFGGWASCALDVIYLGP